jgi:hypothetical protein
MTIILLTLITSCSNNNDSILDSDQKYDKAEDLSSRLESLETIRLNRAEEEQAVDAPEPLEINYSMEDLVKLIDKNQRITGWVYDEGSVTIGGNRLYSYTGVYAYPAPYERSNGRAPENHQLDLAGISTSTYVVDYIDVFTAPSWSRFGNNWWSLPSIQVANYQHNEAGFILPYTYPHSWYLKAASSHYWNTGAGIYELYTGPVQNQAWSHIES